jgi:hypothetical protein
MNRTVLVNEETGKTEVIYESRKTSLQFWITLVAEMITIGAVVFGAARVGLQTETKKVIQEELKPPTGVIYSGVTDCVRTQIEPVQEDINNIENKVIVNETVAKEIRSDVKEIKDDVKAMRRNGGS